MTYQILPAKESDMPTLMDVQFSAFVNDPYHEALFPGDHYSPAVRKDAADRTLQEWRADPSIRFMKCVTDQGRIVGYAKWNLYDRERSEEEWKQGPKVTWCEGRKKEIAENFLGASMRIRQKVWEGRPHLMLNILVVHQDFQRKGAGTALVNWGLKLADEQGLPAYLEASPAGYPLYRKLGFEQIDVAIVKAEEWDGDVDKHYIAMLRK